MAWLTTCHAYRTDKSRTKSFTIIDERKLHQGLPHFIAEDLSRIPSITADPINVSNMPRKLENLESRLSYVEHLLAQPLHQVDMTAAGRHSDISANVNVADLNNLLVSQQLPVYDDQSQKERNSFTLFTQTVSYKKLKTVQNANK